MREFDRARVIHPFSDLSADKSEGCTVMAAAVGMTRDIQVFVRKVCEEAEGVRSYELAHPDGAQLPTFNAGAHVDVHLPNGLVRQYSISNDPAERYMYRLAVLHELAGRGGSRAMHESVTRGSRIWISRPRNTFPLIEDAERSILIAGGIGITPIIAMAYRLHWLGADFAVHYCARTPARTAFLAELRGSPFSDCVRFHHDEEDPAQGLDVRPLVEDAEPRTHIYCCGPRRLMEAVGEAARGRPAGRIHFEHFAAPSENTGPNSTFEIEIASTGAVFEVPPNRSILEVLWENGIAHPASCEEGVCGTCLAEIIEGVADHRDLVLDHAQRESNRLIAVCCSRAKSSRLKLNL